MKKQDIAKRPTLVAVLAWLEIITGAILLLITPLVIWMLAQTPQMKETIEAIGITQGMAIFSVLFLGALCLCAGIGLWKGRRWGWWLGSFAMVYAVLRHASALLIISTLTGEMNVSEANITRHIFKSIGRIILYTLITAYLFRKDVLKYFRMEKVSRIKALAYIIGAGLLITLIGSLWSWFGT
ncbi:MAG: hypothetical protein QXM31_03075 [Candidatus Woesearchaeota archaeon]